MRFLILALLFVASALSAQNVKLFWLETANYTAANVADGISTVRNTRRGFTETQFPTGSAYLIGTRPDAAHYVLGMGLLQVVQSAAAWRLQGSRHAALRWLGHGLMVQGAASHWTGYADNVTTRYVPLAP